MCKNILISIYLVLFVIVYYYIDTIIYNTIKLNILYNLFLIAYYQASKEKKKFRLIILILVSNSIAIKFNIFNKIVIKQLIIIN